MGRPGLGGRGTELGEDLVERVTEITDHVRNARSAAAHLVKILLGNTPETGDVQDFQLIDDETDLAAKAGLIQFADQLVGTRTEEGSAQFADAFLEVATIQ